MGNVRFTELIVQAGFRTDAAKELATQCAGAFDIAWESNGAGAPSRVVKESDAPAVLALLKEHRLQRRASMHRKPTSQHPSSRHPKGGGLNAPPLDAPSTPELPPQAHPIVEVPAVVPVRIGFQPSKPPEVAFKEHCQALIHLCKVLNDDREVVITAGGAEVHKTIKVEKSEKIEG